MVDIGPGHGALIILADPSMLGEELEISHEAAPTQRQHVFVLMRSLPRRTVFAAVFPRLPAGRYLLWGQRDEIVATAEVQEGSVATVTWPGQALDHNLAGAAGPGHESTVVAFTQGV
jgi:hypothetical protein